MAPNRPPVPVLLVEDNEDHAELVKRTLRMADPPVEIVHLRDGEAALEYLGLGPDGPAPSNPRPSLVLLDLRLPRIDGLDVLRQIKESTVLPPIPVVVLTTSSARTDVTRAYSLHANSYLAKPVSFDSFRRLMRDLNRYWTGWNVSPVRESSSPGAPA